MATQTKHCDVSIKDVAEFAGVHRSTASKVLNNDQNCKVAVMTRRRILKAAQHLGFSRNDRLSVPSGVQSFGIMAGERAYDKQANPFYSDVFDGINMEARRLGLNVYLIHNAEQLSLSHLLGQDEFMGVMMMGTVTAGLLAPFELANKPLVGVEAQHHVSSSILYTMHTDFAEGTRQAAEYLLEAGHRRVYYIGFGYRGRHDPGSFERFEGVAAALKAAGLYSPKCLIVAEFEPMKNELQSAVAMGYRGMQELLAREKEYPLACVCYSDLHAAGAYKAAKEAGLRIPEDVSVVGYDNLPQCETMDPPLSTISVPRVELGRGAVRLFLEIAAGGAQHETVVPSRLVVRKSILHM